MPASTGFRPGMPAGARRSSSRRPVCAVGSTSWPASEAAFHPEIREAIIEYVVKRARALMTAFVEKKIRDGEFRNLSPAVIVRVGFSLLAGYVFFKHIAFPDEGIKLDDDEEIALMVDILLHGVRNPHRRDEKA